jgi:hypothetical protein
MDVRSYYKKVREAEEKLTGEYMVMVSLATPEGGKENVKTEVPRGIAAKLIAEGRSRVATEEESKEFHEATQYALLVHQEQEAARRLQVMVIPSSELRKQKERS